MNFVNILTNVTCGNTGIVFDQQIPYIIKTIVTVIKIAVPILLVVFGMLDLGKSVIAQKDEEIKKGQKTFFKRCLAAAIVFFLVIIVQFIINLVAGNDKSEITQCLNCLLNNNESCAIVQDSLENVSPTPSVTPYEPNPTPEEISPTPSPSV